MGITPTLILPHQKLCHNEEISVIVILNPSPVILSEAKNLLVCSGQAPRRISLFAQGRLREESPFVAQGRLREESPCLLKINSVKNLIESMS